MIPDEVYKKIKRYAILSMEKSKNKRHDHKHVLRVKNNALKIVKILDFESRVDKNILRTVCLFHDLTYTQRKSGILTYLFEGHFVRKITREVLIKFEIPESTSEVIEDAVYRHAHSFPFRRLNKNQSIYTKILQDADTLDGFNTMRVKLYMKENKDGFLGSIKRNLGSKLIKYGKVNLASFLNYPILAKSFYFD